MIEEIKLKSIDLKIDTKFESKAIISKRENNLKKNYESFLIGHKEISGKGETVSEAFFDMILSYVSIKNKEIPENVLANDISFSVDTRDCYKDKDFQIIPFTLNLKVKRRNDYSPEELKKIIMKKNKNIQLAKIGTIVKNVALDLKVFVSLYNEKDPLQGYQASFVDIPECSVRGSSKESTLVKLKKYFLFLLNSKKFIDYEFDLSKISENLTYRVRHYKNFEIFPMTINSIGESEDASK